MGEEFLFTAITSDPALIRAADEAGVQRIGIDVERIGKSRRQGHIVGARISDQRLEELFTVAANVRQAQVFVRVNPIHDRSRPEIDRAIGLGARVVMLPQFSTVAEVERFVSFVGGRAAVVLLLETAEALARVEEIVAVGGVSEVMVGLNDLHMALGMSSHFEVVVSDAMTRVAETVLVAGLRLGFGGVARPDDHTLPVPPELVIAQYARLSATSAWLSRSFFRGLCPDEVGAAVQAVRARIAYWGGQSRGVLEERRAELAWRLRTQEFVL